MAEPGDASKVLTLPLQEAATVKHSFWFGKNFTDKGYLAPVAEHIGTKTAVQIRSHAQKFFSKVSQPSRAQKIP